MLAQKIEDDLKTAMKARDTRKVETLRMLKAALSNYLIEKKKDSAEDAEVLSLIQKQVKLRLDSIEGFQKGNRADLVQKETTEKAILESYLPKALTDQELRQLVESVIRRTGAKAKSDLGRVMKEAVAEARGRADGKRISELAGSLLSTPS